MGASDWAGKMVKKLEQEYGVDQQRGLQLTNRVRKLIADPNFKKMEEEGLLDQDFGSKLIRELIELLNKHDEETVEGRWNALARERGIYDLVGEDALLYDVGDTGLDPEKELSSEDEDSITIQEAVSTAWREEIHIEAVHQGIRLGNTVFRFKNNNQIIQSQFEQKTEYHQLHEQLSRDLAKSRLSVDDELLALKDIEFSVDAPRQTCVLAVAAVRRYILDHKIASREEILEAIEPEKNHPLGINGAQARAKGFVSKFRDIWWEDVVVPGLRLISDVKELPYKSTNWISTDTITGGLESKSTVEDILDAGYLFEVTYVDEGENKQVVGYHDEITRPSAKPLNGPPVFRFTLLTENQSLKIRLSDLRKLSPTSLKQLPESISDEAISEVPPIADTKAELISFGDIEFVLNAIQNDNVETATGLKFINSVLLQQESIPESILDDLEDVLRNRLNRLTDGDKGNVIAKSVGIMAEVAPERALDAIPAMASSINKVSLETRRWLIYTFSHVSETYPEELLPAVEILIECIEETEGDLRVNALSTLGQITEDYPDAAVDIVDTLGELLASDESLVRANAAGLLADIAQSNSEAVIEFAPNLAAALTADDEETRVHASITLLRAGEADPDAVFDERDQLVAALNDSNPAVRANTCSLIGNAKVPVPIDQLRPLEDDANEEVRKQASWALDRISDEEDI